MRRAPTDPVEFNTDDFLPAMDRVYRSSRVRLIVPAQAWELVRRLRDAPRREKWVSRVDPRRLSLVPHPEARPDEPWKMMDADTGLTVTIESDGSAFRDVPYPPGAFTVGELALLEHLLWQSSYRAAEAAEGGTLGKQDREAAVELVDAADELSMRLAVLKIQPSSSEEEQALKEAVLELLARDSSPDANPKGYGPVRPTRTEVTWVRPSPEARKVARAYLRRVEKLPPSRRGALTKKEASKQGITSGVERAESIARGDMQPAEDLRDFFNRFKGTYRNAIEADKPWERSKVQQAWDAWGGTPMWRDAMKALGEPPPDLFANPVSCRPEAAARFVTEAIHRGWLAPVMGGIADGMSPAHFPIHDLAAGLCVELEHTNDWELALRIAMDHLVDHSGYYRALARMEAGLEATGNPYSDGELIGTAQQAAFAWLDYLHEVEADGEAPEHEGDAGTLAANWSYEPLEFVACGAWRCVFSLTGTGVVVKFPWRTSGKGYDDNLREFEIWRRAEGDEELQPYLAPALAVEEDGSWLLMEEAGWAPPPPSHDEYPDEWIGLFQAADDLGVVDLHRGNIGRIDGRLVMIDYASNPYSEDSVPDKYVGDLKGKKAKKRREEIAKRSAKDSDDPKAYEPFATDEGEDTKKSRHTQRYHELYGKGGSVAKVAKETGIPKRVLQEVYDRGLAAWRTGHRPGATQHQWALARVYSFATGGPTWRTADKDLAKKARSAGFKPKKNPVTGDFEREAELIMLAVGAAGIDLSPPPPGGRSVPGAPLAFIGEGLEASVFASSWGGRPVVAKLYLEPTRTVERSAKVFQRQVEARGPIHGVAEVLVVLEVPGEPDVALVIQERVTRLDDLDVPGAPPFAGVAAPYLAEALEEAADSLRGECPEPDDLGAELRGDLMVGAVALEAKVSDLDGWDTLDWSKHNVGVVVRSGRIQAVILDFGL